MFETLESAEIRMPGLLSPGTRAWNFVGHGLQMPWFHIAITAEDGGSIIFATDLEQMLRITSNKRPDQQMTVQLVSPPWMNWTTEWRMETLREVWKCPSNSHAVYIVKGLRRYSDSDPDSDRISLHGLVRIFEQRPDL
jgi:hypothetical protein